MATTTVTPPAGQTDRPRSQQAEESGLARIAGWCHDHRWWVLIIWLVGLVGMNVGAQMAGSNFSNNLSGGSQPVQHILDQAFPNQSGSPAQVVITSPGSITAASVQDQTAKMVAAVGPLAHVSEVVSPFSAAGAQQISRDGHIAYVRVLFDQQAGDLPQDAIKTVVTTAQSFAAPGYHVALGGQAISMVAGAKPGPSEGIGILAAIIIMLLAFGSVVAMGLPIITALFGIAIAFAVLDLLSHVITTPVFAPEMMAMIGLGVGIDYALFIVTRYRQGLAEGRTPRQSTAVSLATSGRSVVFAGTTVILSLVGLFILQLPFMRGLAVGAIAAVVLVMLAAVTLLPAMLGFAGPAVDRLHVPGLLQNAAEPSERGFWYRWSRTVQRRPIVAALASLVCLIVLILPFFSMRLAFTDAGNDPPNTTTRQAFDALATGFGPGFNGPLIVAASVPEGQKATVDALQAKVAATPGVAFATPAQFSKSGHDAVIVAYPTTSPQSAKTEAIVHTLRNGVIPAATSGTGVAAYVGGETAGSVDASSYLSARLVWVIGVVLLLSRIREEWRLTGDNSGAVADGLAKTARVITAAAAIMICVFGSFVIGDPLHVLKVFGLGLAAAILIDATLVRMVLVPSVMELLGSSNWWMPAWLDRIVPHLGVEVDVAKPTATTTAAGAPTE